MNDDGAAALLVDACTDELDGWKDELEGRAEDDEDTAVVSPKTLTYLTFHFAFANALGTLAT